MSTSHTVRARLSTHFATISIDCDEGEAVNSGHPALGEVGEVRQSQQAGGALAVGLPASGASGRGRAALDRRGRVARRGVPVGGRRVHRVAQLGRCGQCGMDPPACQAGAARGAVHPHRRPASIAAQSVGPGRGDAFRRPWQQHRYGPHPARGPRQRHRRGCGRETRRPGTWGLGRHGCDGPRCSPWRQAATALAFMVGPSVGPTLTRRPPLSNAYHAWPWSPRCTG